MQGFAVGKHSYSVVFANFSFRVLTQFTIESSFRLLVLIRIIEFAYTRKCTCSAGGGVLAWGYG